MVKAPMEVYHDTLTGYIHDEDKLVTYKWLSKELEVHVNTAKEILSDYWEHHKKDEIVATILLIGDTKDGGQRVEVVKETDLSSASKAYKRIKSQHIYSLQKTLTDLKSLASAGKGSPKFSAIKCNESVLLTDEELFSKRWGSDRAYQAPFDEKNEPLPVIKIKEPVNPLKKAFANAKESKEKDQVKPKESPETIPEVKKSSPAKTEKKGALAKKPVQSTQKGFTALFGKVQNQKKSPPSSNETKKKESRKEESPMEVDEAEAKVKEPEVDEEVSNSGAGSREKKSKKKVEDRKEESGADNKKSGENQGPEKTDKKKETSEKPKSSGKKNTKTNRGTKRERSRESQTESKKRKRILVVSDSSEESEAEEEIDPFGTSISEEVESKERSLSPEPVVQIEGKRKVRKMVDKHFVDEDGFMVTKKVQVMESCSEDEEAPQPIKEKKKSPVKSSVTAKANKKNTKQPSIMSFFKKS